MSTKLLVETKTCNLWDQNKNHRKDLVEGKLHYFVYKGPEFQREMLFYVKQPHDIKINILVGILKKLFKKPFYHLKWYPFPSTQLLGTAWEPLNVFDPFPKEVS